MPRRRLAAAAAITIGAMTLGACAATDGGEEAAGLTLADVQDAGELVVGTEGTYSPFSFHEGGSGELTGYDVEVIEAVAAELGVDVRFEETQWDAMFAGLDSGRFDVIANQVSITPEREEQYVFSTPYSYSPGVLIVPSGSEIASLDDLEGHTSAQSLTSNWSEVAEQHGATIEQVEGFAQAAELLASGRVDATINDELTFLDYQQAQGGDVGLEIVDETDEVSESAVTLRQGSDELADAISDALVALAEDGTLAEISDRYFGADVSQP